LWLLVFDGQKAFNGYVDLAGFIGGLVDDLFFG